MGFLLLAAQTLVLVAGCALLGQFLVGAFNWRGRQQNLVYRLFQVIASPVVKVVRWVTPKVVIDQHIPIAAFMVLLFAYFWLGFEHRSACRENVSQAGCEKWAAVWSGGGASKQ
jgi:uncharacterized protein YggT (Ycf19 family)